ncbi:hypothetical protein LCGC14_0734720 [marine sediment metagenome]|uniref:Uncharacterized protein n=1 Tax=marine sediment metagenome TaxID=412755 RepID=A0A0F9Q8N5_9ZZZZ
MVSWWDATAIDGESGVSEFEIYREDSPSIRFVVHGESARADGSDATESDTGGDDAQDQESVG